jgi:cytoskeletal protein RodZ
MKLSEKAKKRIMIAGLGAVCVIFAIAIAWQFKSEKPDYAAIPTPPKAADEMQAASEITAPAVEPTKESEVAIQPVEPSTEPAKASDTGDSTGTEQSIQEEPTKPAEPSEEAKTDPTKKPDGEKVTNTTPVEHDKVTKPENSTPPSTPKSGDKKDGKIYVPGFGWIEDNGGGGSGTTAEDMYENGNKIGNMD